MNKTIFVTVLLLSSSVGAWNMPFGGNDNKSQQYFNPQQTQRVAMEMQEDAKFRHHLARLDAQNACIRNAIINKIKGGVVCPY